MLVVTFPGIGSFRAAVVQVAVMLLIARGMVAFFWRHQLDPDDHVIPLLTAVGDVLGTAFLAAVLYVHDVTLLRCEKSSG